MTWFWMNIPLAALFFLAWTLIPLWMVFKHPDTGPDIPAGDARPPSHEAPAASSASAPPQSAPAVRAHLPGNIREEALAGHR